MGFRVEQIRRIRGLRATEAEEPAEFSNADKSNEDDLRQEPKVSVGLEGSPNQQLDVTCHGNTGIR